MTTYTFDENTVSDLYKDVYGTRSMGYGWANLTNDEKQTEWDYLLRRLDEVMDEEARGQAYRAEQFEQRIVETMTLVQGATRLDAIRIIAQAEGRSDEELSFYGWECLEFDLGLKYGYIKEAVAKAA